MNRSNKKKPAFAGIVIIVSLACLALLCRLGVHHKGSSETVVVRKGAVIQKILATGALFPLRTVHVCSRVSGVIKNVYVGYNSPVQKGQLLAVIDTKEFKAEEARARANVAVAEAMADKEDINYRQAKSRLARTEVLAKDKAIPQINYEEALAAFEAAAAQKKAAAAQLDQTQAALRTAMIRLYDSRIVSPMKGMVLSRNAEVGQNINQTALQESSLFTIASDLSIMELRAEVSESDIGKVIPGQEVSFTVDAFPDTLFKGIVKAVRMEPLVDQKSVSYGVMTEIENTTMLFKPGMTATIWIETAKKNDVLIIPGGACIEINDRSYVEVPEGEKGSVKRREVRTGLHGHDGAVEIISGLSVGDSVILTSDAKKYTGDH